jgi:hypothetical protein
VKAWVLLLALFALPAYADGVKLLLNPQSRAALDKEAGGHLTKVMARRDTHGVLYVGSVNVHAVDARVIEITLEGKTYRFVGGGTPTAESGVIWTGSSDRKDTYGSMSLVRGPIGLIGTIMVSGREYMLRPLGRGGAHVLVRVWPQGLYRDHPEKKQ